MGYERRSRQGEKDGADSLDGLFNPESIALVGASGDPRKISGRPIAHLKVSGYRGPVYPVNPNRAEVQGLKAYPSLAAIGAPVDLVMIAVGAEQVPAAVDEAIAVGARVVVIFSAGFAEMDEPGLKNQIGIASKCAQAGVRLLGPNCLGLASFATGAWSTFSHSLEFACPKVGPVAMVSQSGAVATYALVKGVRRGIGFSRFIATGNEADVDVSACIEWLANDPETRVILAYLESCGDGRRLASALAAAHAAGKPVIILKSGDSDTGAQAAASHTGALAGHDAIFDAVFRQTGAIRVTGFDEMMDLAYVAATSILPSGNRLAVATVSGGFGVMMADQAAKKGIELPQFSEQTRTEIRCHLAFATTNNPVDVTPQLLNDFSTMPKVLNTLLEEGNFDTLAVFFGTMGLDDAVIDPLIEVMLAVKARNPEQFLVLCTMATDAVREAMEAHGIPVFEDPDRLVNAVASLARFSISQQHSSVQGTGVQADPVAPAAPVPAQLSEADARNFLEECGLPFVPVARATNPEDATQAAMSFGGRVVFKIVSPDIAHKSDIGGVMLNLTPDTAARSYKTIVERVSHNAPQATIEGVLISPMIEGGVETVIGAQHDPIFGPVVMFGIGGIHVEVFQDVIFRLAPVSEVEAMTMINEIRGRSLLNGVRGQAPADLPALAKAIVAVSRFAMAHENDVETVEVNPFVALPVGGVAVDALIVPRLKKDQVEMG